MSQDRVLIVDDAGFIREILNRICSSAGFLVVGQAVDGEEAVRQALALKPNFVLMDLVMPKKNGIQATKEILESLADVKVIACSTIEDDMMIEQALSAGCIDYLKKPFSRTMVINILNKHTSLVKEQEDV